MYNDNNEHIEQLIDEIKIQIDIDRQKENYKNIEEKMRIEESKFELTKKLFENINLSTDSENIKLSNSCPNLITNSHSHSHTKSKLNIKKKTSIKN